MSTQRAATAGPARRLVLLRHGVTGHNAAGIWQGHLDTELSDEGLGQAEAAAAALAAYDFARIVSSDLLRAARTAQVVGAACGLTPTYDARLREIHVGAWQGLDSAGVESTFPGMQARLAAGEDLVRGGDGESVADVVRRGRPALDQVIAELPPGGSALIVSHGVAARALAADLAGIDQRTAWLSLAGLGNCAWAELTEAGRGWRVSAWNASAAGTAVPHVQAHGY